MYSIGNLNIFDLRYETKVCLEKDYIICFRLSCEVMLGFCLLPCQNHIEILIKDVTTLLLSLTQKFYLKNFFANIKLYAKNFFKCLKFSENGSNAFFQVKSTISCLALRKNFKKLLFFWAIFVNFSIFTTFLRFFRKITPNFFLKD